MDDFKKYLESDQLYEMFQSALDKNMVVFDVDSMCGIFSKRLVTLMKAVHRHDYRSSKLDYILISPEAAADVEEMFTSFETKGNLREIKGHEYRMYNIDLIINPYLGENQYYQDRMTDDGLSLPNDDIEVCLGVDMDNEYFLLGSY